MDATDEVDETFEIVARALLRVTMAGVTRESIVPGSRIVEDLGVDSLRFVELTVALESALRIDEFPMQQWVDERVSLDQPLSVESLVAVCSQLRGAA
jgi:acyl carrier protein